MADMVTGEAVVVDVSIARMGTRIYALLIDLSVEVVALGLVYAFAVAAISSLSPAWLAVILVSLVVLIQIGYPTIFETLSRGRSLGKLALGLRVVSDDGGPERFRQALFRALAGYLEFWLLLGWPALITALLSERSKRLGDLFAGTTVIQERVPVPYRPTALMPPQLAVWARQLEMSRLPDDLALMGRQYLTRFYELGTAARAEMGQRLAAAIAEYVSPPAPPATPPAAYISAVLAERRARESARLGLPAAFGPPPGYPPAAHYPQWSGYPPPPGPITYPAAGYPASAAYPVSGTGHGDPAAGTMPPELQPPTPVPPPMPSDRPVPTPAGDGFAPPG